MVSHYRIERKLGEGGMGEVFLATDTKLDRKVALKFLPPHFTKDPEFKARFEHEAKAAAALNQPNIVTVHELNEHEDRLFIAMEYVDGESLETLIGGGDLPLERTIDIARQICDGLGEAHQAGIVHRDIKPSNILIDKKGRAKILDFGLAKSRKATTETKVGTTLGTLQYESPEQTLGKPVDARSDLFSVGSVLYEMITGRPPFTGEIEEAIRYSILNEEPEPLARYKSGVPQDLQRITSKLLKKDPKLRYQSAGDLAADLAQSRDTTETRHHRGGRKGWIISTSAIAFAVLALLVFKPWNIVVEPSQEATASENRLAVMYFDNLVDPEDSQRLGEIVTSLLITDLSESEYVSVVSTQRLYDILKLLGREAQKTVDRDVASEVAAKANARWMLLGDILQEQPHIVVTAQLVDAADGNVIASQRIEGEAGESIFPLVDRLTVAVKADLALPAAAQTETDRAVAEVTTAFPEAYRQYLIGEDYNRMLYFPEASTHYLRAVEIDTTFAMAYLRLSQLSIRFALTQTREWLANAMHYSHEVSQRERLQIESYHSWFSGNRERAREALLTLTERFPDDKEAWLYLGAFSSLGPACVSNILKAIEIDPLYKAAYNELALTYHLLGDFDRSVWAINKYMSLAPEEANPHDTRAMLYAMGGNLDEAINSYQRALAKKPDFLYSLEWIGCMHLFRQEYGEAERYFRKILESSDSKTRSLGRTALALIPLYQGMFNEALALLDQGLAADEIESFTEGALRKHQIRATIFEEMGQVGLALEEMQRIFEVLRVVSPESQTFGFECHARLLAESDEVARAEDVAAELKTEIDERFGWRIFEYWYAIGCIELIKGDFKTAVENFEKAAGAPDAPLPDEDWPYWRSPTPLILDYFQVQIMLGRAYLESDRLAEATATFEKVLSTYSPVRLYLGIWSVKTHYWLGLAYERYGWTRKAIEQYETFLDIWKNADPGIDELDDARERLANLQS
jgi:serine/threonine protein kinase/Tfp pilus assembly protein PilF